MSKEYLLVELDLIYDKDHYVGKEDDIASLKVKIKEYDDMNVIYQNNRKEENKMAKHKAEVEVVGVVKYSKTNEGKKGGVNFMIVEVVSEFEGKKGKQEWKDSFQVKQFFKADERIPRLPKKDELIEFTGVLTTESREIDKDKWDTTTYIRVDKNITLL